MNAHVNTEIVTNRADNHFLGYLPNNQALVVESGVASVGDMFDVLFTVPSFHPSCQNIDSKNVKQEEEEEEDK
jgi:hypothetical protein